MTLACYYQHVFPREVSADQDGGNSPEARVLATLLTEMDGIVSNPDSDSSSHMDCGVIVLAATNRIEAIDAALLRKGRFQYVLHVPMPNQEERKKLLQYFCDKARLDPNLTAALATQMESIANQGKLARYMLTTCLVRLHV